MGMPCRVRQRLRARHSMGRGRANPLAGALEILGRVDFDPGKIGDVDHFAAQPLTKELAVNVFVIELRSPLAKSARKRGGKGLRDVGTDELDANALSLATR